MGQRELEHLLRDDVGDDAAARLPALVEGLFRQALSGRVPFDVAVVGPEPLAPTGIEDRGPDVGRGRRVGIDLGRHVEAARLRPLNHAQECRHLPQSARSDMHDVDPGPGRRRVRDHLVHRLDRASRLDHPGVADVDEVRHAFLRRDLEHAVDLLAPGPRRVLDAVADPERPAPEFVPQPVLHDRDLLEIGREPDGFLPAAERESARGPVRGRGPVVDDGLPFPARVPLLHVARAALQFECGRDPVSRLQLAGEEVLTVRVQIDKAGTDDETGHVHDDLALQR